MSDSITTSPSKVEQKPTDSSSSSSSTTVATKQFTGYHSFMVNACKFTVDAKYQPLKPLGRGAYGVVWYVNNIAKSWSNSVDLLLDLTNNIQY
jgi:hypothetical protein